jgi:integrase
MIGRHGRVARTPISPADPAVLPTPRKPAEELPAVVDGREHCTREQIMRLAEALLNAPTYHERWRHQLAMTRILDWLQTFPGDDWQTRWLLSGSDEAGKGWGPPGLSPGVRGRLTQGVGVMIVLRAVRPTYAWLSGSRLLGVYAAFRQHNQTDAFAELDKQITARIDGGEHATEALNLLTRMVIVTGKELRRLDLTDFTTYATQRHNSGRPGTALSFAYEVLHAIGGLTGHPPTMRQARARGQLSIAEMVDRYPIAYRPVRDVFVYYLTERAAMLDYGSLINQAQLLVSLFWVDLERHHPGIDSLALTDEMTHAWKQRVRVLPDGEARRGVHTVLFVVRSFYLDLIQWSLEDPARWAAWAAPCPITAADVRGYVKETRRRQARMQQRTRALIPVLPQMITTAREHLDHAHRLLETVRDARPGQQFVLDSVRYQSASRERSKWQSGTLYVTRPDEPGPRFDVARLEDNAFWTWAAVEVLRRTGARIEELLELTHLSLRQYKAPTGEMVPLLQISPSKTDLERVIPADPDLVAVLARIIRRIKGDNGKVPLLHRYDTYERTFGPALPHLFQRVTHHRLQVIPPDRIRQLLAELACRANAVDVDGTPLKFTPHDFRRIFSTETVNSGLPIHIAAQWLGHLDLNTTQGYVAIYPEEVIAGYRRFVDQRRAERPSEEYREPTDTEWTEFRDHFQLRKVALGTCDRPYGTPCQHEHACVRCPMLRMSPAQLPRLLQIETNTRERLSEARRMGWGGEVVALDESLRHIATKKQQAERLQRQAEEGGSGNAALG